VTVHRLFISPEQLAAGPRVKLSPEQSRHLLAVLRLERGAEIEVFDGRGGRYFAVLAGDEVEIRALLPPGPRRVDVVLVQALARGEKMDLVLQKATELGATRIVALAADRAVVKLEQGRGASRAERWRRIAREAARQCGRADVPQVDAPVAWDGVFSLLQAEPDRRAFLLDPAEQGRRLGEAVRGVRRCLVAVGPEGGFSPEERRRAVENGFVPAALGPLVLRTETAGLAALAIVLHVNGELG
jgi:16S rRNA (uracil1498-N3)-methyltransferase